MANAVKGLEQVFDVARMLNSVITDTNEPININNKQIWGEYLHVFSNEDWDNMLTALEEMQDMEPGAFRSHDSDNIRQARLNLDMSKPRSLDKRETKRHAWAAIMTMRETYNRCAGIDLPNAAGQAPKPTNNYSQLFTQ